jgi:hypothetical protein
MRDALIFENREFNTENAESTETGIQTNKQERFYGRHGWKWGAPPDGDVRMKLAFGGGTLG